MGAGPTAPIRSEDTSHGKAMTINPLGRSHGALAQGTKHPAINSLNVAICPARDICSKPPDGLRVPHRGRHLLGGPTYDVAGRHTSGPTRPRVASRNGLFRLNVILGRIGPNEARAENHSWKKVIVRPYPPLLLSQRFSADVCFVPIVLKKSANEPSAMVRRTRRAWAR
jgi:hypothetical protein